ncbi:MAG: magnesium/cobalt transporter CorA [Bacteroidales bacterium]|nr:magnesium/cobalt transporter CorA [Bacteroidales bacterium]
MPSQKPLKKANFKNKTAVKKPGLAPGTLIYTGHKKEIPVKMHIMYYKENFFEEKDITVSDILCKPDEADMNFWLNIDGIHQVELIKKIGNDFNIHPLVLEDITHNVQRPKIEDYEDHLYIVLRMFEYNKDFMKINNEQISFVLGNNYLITFQENAEDLFNNVRERLRKEGTKLRSHNCDYLAYALIDAIVDNYFHILEKIGEDIEELEDRLVLNAQKNDILKVHQLRRELTLLRKSVWPLRDVLNAMQRNENSFFKKGTEIYLRDVYDHTIQVIDTLESYREMVIGMLDVYLSSMSNKMNQIMKVLTIISTIFIPLTFLAGVYGMNFVNFPELKMGWMYPYGFWSFSLTGTALMLWFFRRKQWI